MNPEELSKLLSEDVNEDNGLLLEYDPPAKVRGLAPWQQKGDIGYD